MKINMTLSYTSPTKNFARFFGIPSLLVVLGFLDILRCFTSRYKYLIVLPKTGILDVILVYVSMKSINYFKFILNFYICSKRDHTPCCRIPFRLR